MNVLKHNADIETMMFTAFIAVLRATKKSFCWFRCIAEILPLYILALTKGAKIFSCNMRMHMFPLWKDSLSSASMGVRSPDFIRCFEKWFEGTPYQNHVLGIERHLYQQTMQDSVIEIEPVKMALHELIR